MHKILIVEDDEKLREEIKIFLNNNGYQAETLNNFQETINEILKINPEILLLDINLPNVDGEYVCKEIRKKSSIPIIIITSKNSEIDELLSINNGADHFVTKPFNIHILLAKINSLLRRNDMLNGNFGIIDAKDFCLDINKSMIKCNEKCIELTKNELRILKILVQNRDKIVSREEIMDALWESENFIGDSTLTVNITRVRNKLAEIGLKELLETKRGQGYILKGSED